MSDMNLLLEAGGCVAGYGAYKVVNKALRVPYSVYIANEMNIIAPQHNTEFKMAIDTVLKSSGLKDKNVIVEHIDEAKAKAIAENMFSTLSNGQRKFNNILLRVLKDTDIEKIKGKIYTIGKGKNACFIPKQNSIYLNKDKMAFSAFHEMGHAINYNGKGIKHLLHKLRL